MIAPMEIFSRPSRSFCPHMCEAA